MLQHLYQKVRRLRQQDEPDEPGLPNQPFGQQGYQPSASPPPYNAAAEPKAQYHRSVPTTDATRQLHLEDCHARQIAPERVIGYVDMLNLIYGAKRAGLPNVHWIDPGSVVQQLLEPGQMLMQTNCFLAPRRNSKGKEKADWQSKWVKVIGQIKGLSLHKSHLAQKAHSCRDCGSTWITSLDKMTDVNIATQLIADAFEGRYDSALLISSGSSFNSVLRFLQQRFPNKRFIVAFPPWHSPYPLIHACREHLRIRDEQILNSLLPEVVTLPKGEVIHRPPIWI